jgi:hypothetical protein
MPSVAEASIGASSRPKISFFFIFNSPDLIVFMTGAIASSFLSAQAVLTRAGSRIIADGPNCTGPHLARKAHGIVARQAGLNKGFATECEKRGVNG